MCGCLKEEEMRNKIIILALFIIVALIQLFVPAKMVFDREKILNQGVEYKFKTKPIDPYDVFRGKYISLVYREDVCLVKFPLEWKRNETVYVILSVNKEGYAKIKSISKKKPINTKAFVKARVSSVYESTGQVYVNYPFSRYYMEESKAYDAELAYNEVIRDTSLTTYSLVKVLDGESVLKDVMIDDVSILERVNRRQKKSINK
jgi:uncharacterized membrane-anchored protein